MSEWTQSQEPGGGESGDDLEHALAKRTRDLQAALDQRIWLLNELDHRVKNNLQLISSLMLLQARHAPDPAVRVALNSMLERLNAISTVHRGLFQSENPDRFDVSAFARDLVEDLKATLARPGVSVELALEPVFVPAAKAAPLALVISELMTNALKHAFPDAVLATGRKGMIRLKITRSAGEWGIEIEDDGVGMGVGTDAAGSRKAPAPTGFGLTIVDLLNRQLQARVVREDANPGVRVQITLPGEAM